MTDQATSGQSPAPQPEGTSLRDIAGQIEGLLDDDGHYNPNPDQVSRGHPDYDGSRERDDRGRFKSADAPDEADEADEQQAEDLQADGDVSNEDTEDRDTDEELATTADDEADEGEPDTGRIESLAELAEGLELPLDELKESLTHTFNAAGEEVTVTLAELERGYQKDADYRRSTAKLAEERRAAEQELQARQQAYEQSNHMLAAQLQTAEQLIAADAQSPQMAELRESDPAEWTARRNEIGQRLEALRNMRQQAAQAYDAHTTQMLQKMRENEQKALLDAVPDFGAQHKAKARELMSSLGYSEQEISTVMDHRIIRGALELAELRNEVAELRLLKEQAGQAVKRVKKDVPKMQKPGKKRAAKRGVSRDNLSRLRRKAAQSGSVGDAAKVIENLI